jgi:predicted PurR-regulated permease PerM
VDVSEPVPAARHPHAGPPADRLPYGFRVAGEWAWRLLVMAVVLGLAITLLRKVELLAVAIFVALLFTALLLPVQRGLQTIKVPKGLATVGAMLTGLAVVAGAAAFIGTQIATQWSSLSDQFNGGIDDIRDYLGRSPWNLTDGEIDDYVQKAKDAVADHSSGLVSGAVSTVGTFGELLTGALLAVFSTIFFLHEGDRIWRWFTHLFPAPARPGLDEAGDLAWAALTGYIRGTVIIALVDAISIGIALALFGVPLAAPLALLVFLGAFVPIVGALVSGFVAVAVALATEGVWTAVFILLAVIAIQQVEGHVLQPVIMGRAVAVHPLGVVLSVAAGSVLAGIVGAVIAVPLVAVINVVARNYHRRATEALAGAGPLVVAGPGAHAQPPSDAGPLAD